MLMATSVHWFKFICRSLKCNVTLKVTSVQLHPPKREQTEVNVHQTTQDPTVTGLQTDSNKDHHKYSPTLQNERPLQGKHCSLRHLQDSPASPLQSEDFYYSSLHWLSNLMTGKENILQQIRGFKKEVCGDVFTVCVIWKSCVAQTADGREREEWMRCFPPGTNSG